MRIRATRAVLTLALMAALSGGGAQAQTTTTYTSDALGRVATSTNSAANLQTTYSYDAADNRSNLTVATPGSGGGTPNGVTCTTNSATIQAHSSGTVSTGFAPPSQCTDTTSGATMSLSTWSVSGAGTGTSPSPPTINLVLSIGATVITYTVIDNKGGSASATFTFNRTS